MAHPVHAVAIHGGAGNLARYTGTGRLEEARDMLDSLIRELKERLHRGDAALDVVTHAIKVMEDSALFHAGRGSSPTSEGYTELDASIMDGNSLKAGAVAAVRTVRNPILAARAVMERTGHVLLVGHEADRFAGDNGLDIIDETYFVPCDTAAVSDPGHGTVGAVAMDVHGNMAAATSTGGTLRKRAGRVGDTPIIGAGTYARNTIGAVSCTGTGEYFIRANAAGRLIARMELLGEHVGAATGEVLSRIVDIGGSGGIIAIDTRGNVSMPYSTEGMYRASADASGTITVGTL
ncbi:MAG: isoaspartyl peptidase/L-asparaginase ['Candidatus Kapabacteria' thiocyanatum]|uniref:Isoaspartyl peptidase n=1 Tax=Candidatus Kapaibacterium thiocyanatum TaxID=1895771 RepID=A0A1M3L3Q8_9BACT|nr:isoaspartyl peptidase/L-asparaginase ['Candidatus Kapabacteria' thiocyanatum]OJX59910.1 MAG: hypothetical protein BGO89_07880 ['Candidatus Kapabacteria' thiocyanatum]